MADLRRLLSFTATLFSIASILFAMVILHQEWEHSATDGDVTLTRDYSIPPPKAVIDYGFPAISFVGQVTKGGRLTLHYHSSMPI